MKARVIVTLKNGVLDPQGQAIEGSLRGLGFPGVASVRQGKVFELDVHGTDESEVRSQITSMCDKLLVNTVIENYTVEISD